MFHSVILSINFDSETKSRFAAASDCDTPWTFLLSLFLDLRAVGNSRCINNV